MLEEIRSKNNVQTVVLKQPFFRAILEDNFDTFANSVVGVWVEVEYPVFGLGVRYEVSSPRVVRFGVTDRGTSC